MIEDGPEWDMSDMIRVMLADDEDGIRLILKKRIEKTEGFELCGEAATGEDAVRMFDALHPDVVFLDVDMPGMNGLECARLIQDKDPACIIIFATGHEEYRGEAFEVYAFDYLVKPFRLERLDQTLQRILTVRGKKESAEAVRPPRVHANPGGRLMLKHKDGVTFVTMQDILLIQREDRATVIYTVNEGRYEMSETLSETMEKLDSTVFFRCHKSYIINLTRIKDITPYGRWTYVVRLDGTQHDALITKDRYEELEKLYS